MRRTVLILVAIGFSSLVAAHSWRRDGLGGPALAAGQPAPKKLTTLYFGVDACRKCHNEKTPVPEKDALLYRSTEMSTWDQFDKHKDATSVLKGERSKQMAKLLGWDVAKDRRCLNCHGVVVANEKEIDENSFQPAQREASGVSCVVCHGPYLEWVNNHALVIGGAWKKLTRLEKERDHGLRDLWDPVKRATLCCSCHVGSVPEGKVVTHEMYAAGHPPLPGIEVATFCDAMPRHWETLTEKVTKRPQHKDFHKRIHGFDADRDDNEQARLLAVSSVVALRASLQLVRDLAQQQAAKPDAREPAWPELAAFDCYACHHDLKSESWRQLRASTGRPGRPALRPWPMVLADVSIERLGKPAAGSVGAELHQKRRALLGIFDRTPFGEARDVADKATALLASTDKLLAAIQAEQFDRAAARKLLSALVHRAETEVMDFDSARQIAWAVHALLPAVSAKPAPEMKRHLDLLKAQLHLDLPKGQVRIAEEYLPQVLQRIGAYDPREFQKTMRGVAASLVE